MTQDLFAELKEASGGLWLKAQQHPFVDALADGSLARDSFIHYLKQDYVYLLAYSRSLALATAKADNSARMNAFATLLAATLGVEMELHRDYCAQFGISASELERTQAMPITQAYGDFCISVAATGGPLELLCALVPCGVGYSEIGERLAPQIAAEHPYRQWIETYSSAEFQEYARWMAGTLCELGEERWVGSIAELSRIFNLGCRYEWLFWEMAWKMDGWPL